MDGSCSRHFSSEPNVNARPSLRQYNGLMPKWSRARSRKYGADASGTKTLASASFTGTRIRNSRPRLAPAIDDQTIAFAFNFQGVPLAELGGYEMVCSLDGQDLRRIFFRVEAVSPG